MYVVRNEAVVMRRRVTQPTGRWGGERATDRHTVAETEEVVVVAETAGVVELLAGALAGVEVVSDVSVAAGPGPGRQRTQSQRTSRRRRRRCTVQHTQHRQVTDKCRKINKSLIFF